MHTDLSRRLCEIADLGDPAGWADLLLGKPLTAAQRQLMTAKSGALVSDWRRTGISTGVALRILLTLEREPDANILVVSPTNAALTHLMGLVRELMPAGLRERLVRNSQTPQHLLFEDGRRVIGAHTRHALMGQRASQVFVDVVGFVQPDVLQTLQPIVVSARFVLYSDTDE